MESSSFGHNLCNPIPLMANKRDARGADFHPSVNFTLGQIVHMCVTVSFMLSGLETRSHGLNTLAQRIHGVKS